MVKRLEGMPGHIDALVGRNKHPVDSELLSPREEARRQILAAEQNGREFVNLESKEIKERHRELFRLAVSYVRKWAARYGAPERDYPMDEILANVARRNFESHNGSFRLYSGQVRIEETDNDLEYITTLTHELLHYASPHIFQSRETILSDKDPEGRDKIKVDSKVRRSGIAAMSRDFSKTYFERFEEAIVEEINRRIYKDMVRDPLLSETAKQTEQVKMWLTAQMRYRFFPEEYVQDVVNDIYFIADPEPLLDIFKQRGSIDNKFAALEKEIDHLDFNHGLTKFSRYVERYELSQFIDSLYEKAPHEFASKEEIFDMFARANFTGKLLPLARKVEKILGKGAFRNIAEASSQTTKT